MSRDHSSYFQMPNPCEGVKIQTVASQTDDGKDLVVIDDVQLQVWDRSVFTLGTPTFERSSASRMANEEVFRHLDWVYETGSTDCGDNSMTDDVARGPTTSLGRGYTQDPDQLYFNYSLVVELGQ
jgi:hypothetical protein